MASEGAISYSELRDLPLPELMLIKDSIKNINDKRNAEAKRLRSN